MGVVAYEPRLIEWEYCEEPNKAVRVDAGTLG